MSKKSFNAHFNSITIPDKLFKFWDILTKISDSKIFEIITGQKSNNFNSNIESFQKIWTARNNTDLFIEEIRKRNKGSNNDYALLDIPSLLLTIIIRSEAHEYYLGEILGRIEKETGKLDIPYLLSVECKVLRNNKFNPDTRAIRHATAHSYFRIEKNIDNDYKITFDNTEKGWQFQKEFTRKSLFIFYQDFDLLFIIYTKLLSLKLLHGFLAINFLK